MTNQVDKLMKLGPGPELANVAFNWAQHPGYVLTQADCDMLHNLRLRHDTARAALRSALVEALGQWIPVSERLPDDRQSVAFVVHCKAPSYAYLHGRVLGGIFNAGPFGDFSVPGLTVKASYWRPLPAPPADALQQMEGH